MPTWYDLTLAGWRIVGRRILAVSPAGYTLEVIARAAWQPMSRAHRLTFSVTGHGEPMPDLLPESCVFVVSALSLTAGWDNVGGK